MAGTWNSENKILPGAYLNIKTNVPLSITPGDRGIVVILQEMSVGENNQLYKITATENNWPEGATEEDKLLANEALKKAQMALIYRLKTEHTIQDVQDALDSLKTINFNTLCYPYDGESANSAKEAITAWIKSMREDEGVKCQAVLANHEADYEGIINVAQGVILSNGTKLPAEKTTAWVAGATAGASMAVSNTNAKYTGAIGVYPGMTRSQQEEAVKAGHFVFKEDAAQNVTALYDINSLTTITPEKGKAFIKNRVIRTIDNIANDITSIYESNYIGKVNNNDEGRLLLKASLVEYFTTLQNMNAIQNFENGDVVVSPGKDTDAVLITANIQPVDSVEKIYIHVNLI